MTFEEYALLIRKHCSHCYKLCKFHLFILFLLIQSKIILIRRKLNKYGRSNLRSLNPSNISLKSFSKFFNNRIKLMIEITRITKEEMK